MRYIQNLHGKSLAVVALSTLVIVIVIAFGGLNRNATDLTAQAFQSPIETPTSPPYPPPATPTLPPYPPPPTPAPPPTPSTACPPQIRWGPFEAEIEVEGLPGAERAMLRIQPIREDIAACLASRGITLPEMAFGNGRHRLQLQEIPDGAYYKLEVQAPPSYFRDPAGYLFQVQDRRIVRRPSFAFQFRLVPPAEQDLPPCRKFENRLASPLLAPQPTAKTIPADTQKVVCRAERLVDLSSPPKHPPRVGGLHLLSTGYHYVGPQTEQDNQGVWGRRYVVNPSVDHSFLGPSQFVVEYSYANDNTLNRWMETGWAEVSWRDDNQYVYEFDSATHTWHFFDQFPLSTGSAVETLVEYRPDADTWWALYYLGDSSWALLAEESLGFTIADRGYNWGEIYIAGGTHPILPISGFDKGYLKIEGTWQIWDTRYPTFVWEESPYQADIITEYTQFNIHSSVTFLPLILKNQ